MASQGHLRPPARALRKGAWDEEPATQGSAAGSIFLRTSLPRASLSLPCRPYSAACPLDGVDGCAPPVIPARSRSIRWLMYSGERVLRAT